MGCSAQLLPWAVKLGQLLRWAVPLAQLMPLKLAQVLPWMLMLEQLVWVQSVAAGASGWHSMSQTSASGPRP